LALLKSFEAFLLASTVSPMWNFVLFFCFCFWGGEEPEPEPEPGEGQELLKVLPLVQSSFVVRAPKWEREFDILPMMSAMAAEEYDLDCSANKALAPSE